MKYDFFSTAKVLCISFPLFVLSLSASAESEIKCENVGDTYCRISISDFATGKYCAEFPQEKLSDLNGYNCFLDSPDSDLSEKKLIAEMNAINSCQSMLNRYKKYSNENIVPESFQGQRFILIDEFDFCESPVNSLDQFQSKDEHHYIPLGSYKILTPIDAHLIKEEIKTKVRYTALKDTNFQFARGMQSLFSQCEKRKKYTFDQKNVYFSFCYNAFNSSEYFSDVTEEGNGVFTAVLTTTLYTIVHSDYLKTHTQFSSKELYDEEAKKNHRDKSEKRGPLEKIADGIDKANETLKKIQLFFGRKVK